MKSKDVENANEATRTARATESDTGVSEAKTNDLAFSLENQVPENVAHFVDGLLPPDGYEFREFVGAGGMGLVFRAHDLRLERDIALKILKKREPSESLAVQRFLFEAQVTAQLQHPGIPAVHEVGTINDGRPFLAMKLIKGRDLNQLLSEAETHRTDWLGIFEAICQAVGYAHAHNVVHRDLKPHNVMVGAFGEVQVMDWGLAKLLTTPRDNDPAAKGLDKDDETRIGSARDSGSDYTRVGSVLGTPAYMAPEQAIGAVDKLDQRTDVFGLGGILCAMLTGRPPYQSESAESTRQLAAAAKLDDAFQRLDQCEAEPEWIELTKRCLTSERDARPRDAVEIAETVARLRKESDERARLAEVMEVETRVQLAEQKKRRKVALIGATLACTALIAGIIGTSIGLYRANQQKVKARENEISANERRDEMEEVLKFVDKEVFATARPIGIEDGLGHDVTMRDAVVHALDSIEDTFAERPMIGAKVKLMIATSLSYLSEHELVEPLELEVYELYRKEFGKTDTETLLVASRLANTYSFVGKWDESQKLYEETLEQQVIALGPDHLDTLNSMNALSALYVYRGDYRRASEMSERVLEAVRRIYGEQHDNTAHAMVSLAYAYLYEGRVFDSVKLHKQGLEISQSTLGDDHPSTLQCMHNVAMAELIVGDYAEAARRTEITLQKRIEVLGTDHDNTHWSRYNLGIGYRKLGRFEDAIELFETTLTLWRETLGEDHPATLETKHQLAHAYLECGRYNDANEMFQDVVEHSTTRLQENHPSTLLGRIGLAMSVRALGRPIEALEQHRQAVDLLAEKNGAEHLDVLVGNRDLASLYAEVGMLEESEALLDTTITKLSNKYGENHPESILASCSLAELYVKQGRQEEAVSIYRHRYDALVEKFGDSHPASQYVGGRYAEVLTQADEVDSARRLVDGLLEAQNDGEKQSAVVDGAAAMAQLAVAIASQETPADYLSFIDEWNDEHSTHAVDWLISARMFGMLHGALTAGKISEHDDFNRDSVEARLVEVLQLAIGHGYSNIEGMKKDTYFASVRELQSFRDALAQMDQVNVDDTD